MKYKDEDYIKELNQEKKGVSGSVYTKLFIREEELEFKETLLFEETLSVYLPSDFVDMPVELAKIKYPMEQRPGIIKTNETTSINFTFHLLEEPCGNGQIEPLNDLFYQSVKRAYPSNSFFEKKVEEVNGMSVGWFDFVSTGFDQKIYNIMYCLPLNGQLLLGVFNCPASETENWKEAALQVMRSLKNVSAERNDSL